MLRTGTSPAAGATVGITAALCTVAVFVPFRHGGTLAPPALVLVVAVVVGAMIGGARASIATAVAGAVAFNLALVPPYWTLKANSVDDYVALVVLLAVGVTVGLLVANQSDRRRGAEHREAEVRALYDDQSAAMLRSVSHDLRTPLAAIRAIASDLRAGVVYDDDTRVEMLDVMCDETERLDRLVANLLSMSRIEAGALAPDRQAVDMTELARMATARLRSSFRQVRMELAVADGLPLVDGDYTQLEQVLTNLLENAARHAPPTSAVRVEVQPKGHGVQVKVIDEGTGVAEWERERIFEPFRRGEGSHSSGIGLAICKAIVEAHGGTIAVTTTAGGGATFAFTLPRRG